MDEDKRLDEISGFYATLMAGASGSEDPRLERVFALVPRHAFFPPGPWQIMVQGATPRYIKTPSADPIYLYQNALVALDADRGINNGEPFLHAKWIALASPQPGETVVHIGAGTGYYSALLSVLVLPGGTVTALELQPELSQAAEKNLAPFENVTVVGGDAVAADLASADLIYVNAAVVAPPLAWLQALKPGGRMILPWRPSKEAALAIMIRRGDTGFAVEPLMHAFFIPCEGASDAAVAVKTPSYMAAWASRSLHFLPAEVPDDTATAVYKDLWFSSQPLG